VPYVTTSSICLNHNPRYNFSKPNPHLRLGESSKKMEKHKVPYVTTSSIRPNHNPRYNYAKPNPHLRLGQELHVRRLAREEQLFLAPVMDNHPALGARPALPHQPPQQLAADVAVRGRVELLLQELVRPDIHGPAVTDHGNVRRAPLPCPPSLAALQAYVWNLGDPLQCNENGLGSSNIAPESALPVRSY
jgi:hypothetical protein